MNWSKGYTVLHYASIVDPVTWKDIERIEIEQGSISRGTDSLVQSANIDCAESSEINFETEKWIRIYADIRQTEDNYHGAIFTGLISTPTKNIEGSKVKYSAQCYSVLKPAEDVLLDRGWYASAKSDAVSLISKLLSVSPAPILVGDGISGELPENIIAENNETNLSMVWKILKYMNWHLSIDGRGFITISQYPDINNNSIIFDANDNDCLETSVTVNCDWFSCPNVFRAMRDTAIAVARDESSDSPLSIRNRGREVWVGETDCALQTNETLANYAKRRLAEEQNAHYEISYTRRFHPDVDVYDIIRLNYPEQDIVGFFEVTSQSITLGHAISVSETAIKRM